MGHSSEQKELVNNTYKVFNDMSNKKKDIEKKMINEEISKRRKNDIIDKTKKKGENKLNNQQRVKFILNIYIYSNDNINNNLLNSFKIYNSNAFDWKVKPPLIGFSQENTDKLLKDCEEDFNEGKFMMVVVVSIKSISNFKTLIEQNEKDFLAPFNEKFEEQQPFFLFIDEEEKDFNCTKEIISFNLTFRG